MLLASMANTGMKCAGLGVNFLVWDKCRFLCLLKQLRRASHNEMQGFFISLQVPGVLPPLGKEAKVSCGSGILSCA